MRSMASPRAVSIRIGTSERCADAAAHLEAVDVGQHQVEDERVERSRFSRCSPRARSAPRQRDSRRRRDSRDHRGEALVVVDDEDAAGHDGVIAG